MEKVKVPNREDGGYSPFVTYENGCMKILNRNLTWGECEDIIKQLETKFKGRDIEYGIMEYENVPIFLGEKEPKIDESELPEDIIPRRKKTTS